MLKKNKLVVLVTLILSCIIQLICFNQAQSTYYENGFMIGILNEPKPFNAIVIMFVLQGMLPLLLPVFFILFFTSESVENLTHGYGKILIVRNYSKTILILKNCLKNCIKLICIIAFQLLIFLFINKNMLPVESGMLKSLLMYFLTLNALILIQGFLEIYIPAHIVNIIIFIYCFISYFLVNVISNTFVANIILFPSLMFGMQNGAATAENTYYLYLSAVIAINLLFLILFIKKFKKVDIF